MNDENFFIDEQIPIPKAFDNRVKTKISCLKRTNKALKTITISLASLLLILSITLGLGNEMVYAYTKSIPVVGDVLSWFRSEKEIIHIKEKGYPLYDYTGTHNGYKLYVKDLYLDNRSISMKLAVEDSNGDYLEGFEHQVILQDRASFYKGYESQMDPWHNTNIHYDFLGENRLTKDFNFSIRILGKEGKLLSDYNIKIPTDRIKVYEPKIIKQELTRELRFCTISINQVEINPTSMYVRYDIYGLKEGYTTPSGNFTLVDKYGKIIDNGMNQFTNSENGRTSYQIMFKDTSIYFENPDELYLQMKFTSENGIEEKVTVKQGDDLSIPIHNGKYIIKKVEKEKDFKLAITVEGSFETNSLNLGPKLAFKNNSGIWDKGEIIYNDNTEFANPDLSIDCVTLTEAEVEYILGDSIRNIIKSNQEEFQEKTLKLYNYIADRVDGYSEANEYSLDLMQGLLRSTTNRGHITFPTPFMKLFENKRVYNYYNNIDGLEEYEIGILGDKESETHTVKEKLTLD